MTRFGAVIVTLGLLATINVYAETAPEARIAAGRKLFERHCSECHGPEGLGTERAPSVAAFVRNTDRSSLQSFVKNGNLRRGMPSWSKLPDQRLDQIVTYLKSAHSLQK
jgi:mono/diheme cytochrome c family protein